MAVKLTELLRRIPEDTESKVNTARKRALGEIRNVMRSKCNLELNLLSNRIKVSPGYPAELENIEFSDDIEVFHLLCLYRHHLENVNSGGKGLIDLLSKYSDTLKQIEFGKLRNSEYYIDTGQKASKFTTNIAQILLNYVTHYKDNDGNHPLTRILSIEEDILGVYKYRFVDNDLLENSTRSDTETNWASIELYWAVIGLSALWKSCKVEDLAVVVLTHELGHAFTQLGADSEGRIWNANHFAETNINVTEGLAQYYTHFTLNELSTGKFPYPNSFTAYEQLMSNQNAVYRSHLQWIQKYRLEDVRLAMLEFRRKGETLWEEFDLRLQKSKSVLSE